MDISNLFLENNAFSDADNIICSGHEEQHENYFGAVSPPIIQTSLFVQKNYQAYCDDMQHEAERFIYSRGLNPTVQMVEEKLARLERGEACRCFASGMGAISAVLMANLSSNDHIILVNNIYGPTMALIKLMAKKFGIHYSVVLDGNLESIANAIHATTRMIYVESPGTMTMNVVDLAAIARLASAHNITTAIDNTWATPLFQKPLTLGFDIVIHSCTKYLGGHSDLIAGAVVTSHERMIAIRDFSHQLLGAVLSPFAAWLLLRGLRTLPVRMQRHQENVVQVIEYLKTRPEVENIRHPSLADAAQRAIIRKQMFGFSGLFSFEIRDGGFATVKTFIDSCQLFKVGCSWGGYESLIISPNRGYNEPALAADNIAPGLIRLSIGQESPAMLIADLDTAFAALSAR
ncbi:trans-sulfuration enzyme family protein [Scandinavium manionii]|uniref:trans-sulfuration enzyme family protein n=1 Tax=Scandinavium manionii TaxID=2926520 RepID=UPI00216526FC|nr:PLP-dependent aspartate aminotransferase family protein [Scandinavium manionii]MCS2147214.1 PLP-dependent aspartate aminotransferase family protein [Scandinavium manionii]MCS2164931.1 PLP-dependent aspartate aminotransferase family protein [Scandinavium manionii]